MPEWKGVGQSAIQLTQLPFALSLSEAKLARSVNGSHHGAASAVAWLRQAPPERMWA